MRLWYNSSEIQLCVLPEKERKNINDVVKEDITTAVVETSSESFHRIDRVRNLDMPDSAVRHIMLRILNFYPYSSNLGNETARHRHSQNNRATISLENGG